jgi:hypothetical protein
MIIAPRAPPRLAARRISTKPDDEFRVNEKGSENNSLELE